MRPQSVTIVDRAGNVVATADIALSGAFFSGRVNLDRMPSSLRLLFEQHEDIVNDQVFSLLDQIEDRIDALSLVAVFDDGCEAPVKDLQIFPKEGTVAFRVAEPVEADYVDRLPHSDAGY